MSLVLRAALAVSSSELGRDLEFARVRAVEDTLLAGDKPWAFSARTKNVIIRAKKFITEIPYL